MASDEMGLVPTQRLDNPINPQLLFQDNNPQLRFRGVGEPALKSGFLGDKLFAVDHRDRYFSPEPRRSSGMVFGESSAADRRGPPERRDWNGSGPASTPSSGEDDEEEEDEDDDDDDDDDESGDVEGLVGVDSGGGKNSHGSGADSGAIGGKIAGGNPKNHASFGSSTRQLIMKDGGLLQPEGGMNRVSSCENGQEGRIGNLQKLVTIAEHDGDMYYSQLLQGTEGPSQVQKDIAGDNGCTFSGRRDGSGSSDPAETLRAIFSDPITGTLMDDAMILPCGHSFGGGGIQQIIKMKACYTCSHPISEETVAPNLSLRTAIQAFRREEDLLMYRASKRRRERFEQEKGLYGDSPFLDASRGGRGIQFPFAVTDRVIIKGNKRTPQRFVGREAIVTTQCLNGWYVVKTLDNAESVKLQYRSLEKVTDNSSSSRLLSDKMMTPNWL